MWTLSLQEIIVIDVDQKKTEELANVLRGHFGGAYPKASQVQVAVKDTSEKV